MPVKYTAGIVPLPKTGQVWKMGKKIVTAQHGKEYIKSASGFGSVEAAKECHDIWANKYGYKGAPASPASFWRQHILRMRRETGLRWRMNASINNLFAGGFSPVWVEALDRGIYGGEFHHYDLRSAFMWSGLTQEMPVRFRPWRRSSKDFIALCHGWPELLHLPKILRGRTCLISSADVETYGLDDFASHLIDGVEVIERTSLFADLLRASIDELPPKAGKSLSQSYWGIWAMRSPLTVDSYKDGVKVKSRKQNNRFQNMPIAHTITSAVVRKVWDVWRKNLGLIVYVDSVVSRVPLAVSDGAGNWRHERSFSDGVVIHAPGVWSDAATALQHRKRDWYKHAGYE